jgi:phosphohistidine swiveling domain-containing protein
MGSVITALEDADREGIGAKARRLAKLINLKPHLFSIPSGLVIASGFDALRDGPNLLHRLAKLGPGNFAVRSCGMHEDASSFSLAGKYHTELDVRPSNIFQAVAAVQASFGDHRDNGAVLIQKMIHPSFAGVLFTRSPMNYGLALCEFAAGIGSTVVGGTVEPERVEYGRWSGNLYPAPSGRKADMLAQLFLVGGLLEEWFGAPQDVEWAFESSRRRLTILQSRDITATAFDSTIGQEQERVARLLLDLGGSSNRPAVLHRASVREVVSSPSRLTRSLLERLYSARGSLGQALKILDLDCPAQSAMYVTSVFGRLYADSQLERKLFGRRPRSWWAVRQLRRRMTRERMALQSWLAERIDALGTPLAHEPEPAGADVLAVRLLRAVHHYIDNVYPTAYVATFLAQLAQEQDHNGSATGLFLSDLSRLNHTENIGEFLARWGHRSANDYELSEPRFWEAPERALRFASQFAGFPWHVPAGEASFTGLKEHAKDRAIAWLQPIRQSALRLETELGLDKDQVFLLDLVDIAVIARHEVSEGELKIMIEERLKQETLLPTVDLGDEITLTEIERLQSPSRQVEGLHGTMVAAKVSFTGIACHLTDIQGELNADEVLITQFLDPKLAGLFNSSVGCIADIGGSLSHAAILGRELGYPILVLDGSTTTIKNGDRIEVSAEGRISIERGSLLDRRRN